MKRFIFKKLIINTMIRRIQKVAVLGSGVMGSGIACRLEQRRADPMTTIPKAYIVPARWQRNIDGFMLIDDKGVWIATITLDLRTYVVKTKNRRGGWNYASAGNVRAAKAKAKKMLREEQTQ